MGQVTGKPMRADWPGAWAMVRDRLRRELGDPVFEAWIGPLSLEAFERDELKIGAAKPFVRNWVANHYVAHRAGLPRRGRRAAVDHHRGVVGGARHCCRGPRHPA